MPLAAPPRPPCLCPPPAGRSDSGPTSGPQAALAASLVMGAMKAEIGVSIMHDANHGSYSRSGAWGALMGATLDLAGASRSARWAPLDGPPPCRRHSSRATTTRRAAAALCELWRRAPRARA